MEVESFGYRRLDAYKYAMSFTTEVYKLLKTFPKEEQYALCDQLRRATVSIPSNIAEGMGRSSIKEQVHFLEIAYGSLNETMCQVEIARNLGYITDLQLNPIEEQVRILGKLLSGLRKSKIQKLKD